MNSPQGSLYRANRTSRLLFLLVGTCLLFATPQSNLSASQQTVDGQGTDEVVPNGDRTPNPDELRVAAPWRSPNRDAANSLFLFWKLHQHNTDYESLVEALPEQPSILDLKQRSNQAGINCEIIKPVLKSPDSFKDLQLPAIVLLDSDRARGSGFHVVYAITETREVRMVSGSEMTWNQMSLDEFLRHWTGHMLVAQTPNPNQRASYWPVIVSTLVFVGYVLLRRRSIFVGQPSQPINASR